jgi:transposase
VCTNSLPALDIRQERDIERLREAALLLEAENQRLVGKVSELTRALAGAKGEDALEIQLRIAELEAQLARRNHLLFAPSSEKRPGPRAPSKEARPQRGHGPTPQPELPVVERVAELDVADKQCKSCGGELQTWAGQFEESDEVDVLERKFILVKHRRQKYRCRCGGCIETAVAPLKLFEGARYSIDFAIDVAIAKYLDHLPLERQARIMGREGLSVTSQTLWDYLERLVRPLEGAYGQLGCYQRLQSVVCADETRWPLMGAPAEERSKWYVWALATARAVFYKILESRSAEAARELLGDYQGVVMADGYSAYEALRKRSGGFALAHCWSHVRREYLAAEATHPQAAEALHLIGELYAVERLCTTGPPGDEERLLLRAERSRPIVQRLHAWALEQRTLPESALGKAISYMGGLWPGLILFLEDGRIPLDNNGVERALRGPVIGRKNHYGSRSRRGTEVAAIIYSLVESAKLCELEPKAYLRAAVHAALKGEHVPLPHELASAG